MKKYLIYFILLGLVISQSKQIPDNLKELIDEATRDVNKAADFLAHDISGKEVRLSDYSGRAVSYTHLTLPTICSV